MHRHGITDIDGAIVKLSGMQTGNKLLKKLAGLFRKTVKKNDFIARLEADEFAFLFANVGMKTIRS